jgi:phosphohistidine phosphatase
MVKRLLILRHAEAAPATNGDDFARQLTARGKADAHALGKAMAQCAPAASIGFVSPARRTVETFEVFTAATGWTTSARFEPSLYDATPEMILALIAGETAETVLVVGHNPTLAELAPGAASHGDPAALAHLRRQFPAPCLAALVFEASSWADINPANGRLDYFLTPAALR